MTHINETVQIITERAGSGMPQREALIKLVIMSSIVDVCQMLKNIRETSLGESDKLQRIELLAQQTGFDSLTLKNLC